MRRPSLDIHDIDVDAPGRRRRSRRQRRADRERRRVLGLAGWLDFEPRPIPFVESRPHEDVGIPKMFRAKRRRVELGAVLAGVFGLGTLAVVGVIGYRGLQVDVQQRGIEDGDALTPEELAETEVTIELASADDAESATLRFDAEPVEEPDVRGELLVWVPPAELDDGEHVLELSVPRPLIGDARFTWEFTVDSQPPTIEVPAAVDPVPIDGSAELSGRVERDATLTADGREVPTGADGSFTLAFTRPPAGPIRFEAADPAGNVTAKSVVVPVRYPGARGVHVTAPAWASETLRGGILRLVDEGRIDAVELTIKDEGGVVGHDSRVRRAHDIGAVTPFYDLADAVATLKDRDVRVVGRIAAFRDPILARAAWGAGQHDQVLQTSDGRPWAEPGQYTNFAHAAVRRYNIDLALEAIELGVDDILWDDIGLPVGSARDIVVPGAKDAPADAVVGFLAEAHAELRRRGVYQGVVTAGIAADQGDLVAQDVPRIARNADYVTPEVHPAEWGPGWFGLSNPAAEPGPFAARLVERYADMTKGSGAVLVPYLQDFSAGGVSYGPDQVRAQIAGAGRSGAENFILWDPLVTYTAEALDPLG